MLWESERRGGRRGRRRARVLLARAGLVPGPWEDVGQLPWWLDRIARGGRGVAPGDPDRGLQYVNARDLAHWLLDAREAGRHGPVDVVSRPGHATTRSLLEACVTATSSDAELVWVAEDVLEQEGVEPWTKLPCWVPSTGVLAGLMATYTSKAAETGLVCRSSRRPTAVHVALDEVGDLAPYQPSQEKEYTRSLIRPGRESDDRCQLCEVGLAVDRADG